MKHRIPLLLLLIGACCALNLPLFAQPGAPGGLGGPPRGPKFGGAMSKLFGENKAFSAQLEMQTKNSEDGEQMIIPGKFLFHEGKTRFELDITEIKGAKVPPQATAQIKALGLGEMIMISRPDKKLAYLVYPAMKAYVVNPLSDHEAAGPDTPYKLEVIQLGTESVENHPCAKNKVIVTDDKAIKHEATVWNASDLNNFPLKIDTSEDGQKVAMLFREVKFIKSDAAVFDAPAGFTRYASMGEMMRGIMLKQLGGGLRKE